MMPLTPAPTTKAEQAIVDRIVEVIDATGFGGGAGGLRCGYPSLSEREILQG